MPSKVAVLGAGVIGLAVGVRLLEEVKDVSVTVFADLTGNETTSRGSGGLWQPYSLGLFIHAQWAKSLICLRHLGAGNNSRPAALAHM